MMEIDWLLAAGLNAALGAALGVIFGIGFLGSCAALVASALGGFGERSIAGIKVSVVCAVVCGLSWLIATALFQAGGIPENVVPTGVN